VDDHLERLLFRHRLTTAIRFLEAVKNALAAAHACPDYAESRRKADHVMKRLVQFINSARPPNEEPLAKELGSAELLRKRSRGSPKV
jgi:hypothetical protein